MRSGNLLSVSDPSEATWEMLPRDADVVRTCDVT